MMTKFCYKSGKSMMTGACYEGGELMMTNLIIIKIRFVCFWEDEVGGSSVRSDAKSHDQRSLDHGVM